MDDGLWFIGSSAIGFIGTANRLRADGLITHG